jgi:hypothetical protein
MLRFDDPAVAQPLMRPLKAVIPLGISVNYLLRILQMYFSKENHLIK